MSRPAVPMTMASSSSQSSCVRDGRQGDRLTRPDDRRRRLDEQLRHDHGLVDALAAALFDVRLEVAGDGEELARSADRREQARPSRAAGRRPRRRHCAAASSAAGPAWSSASRSPVGTAPPDASARSTIVSVPASPMTAPDAGLSRRDRGTWQDAWCCLPPGDVGRLACRRAWLGRVPRVGPGRCRGRLRHQDGLGDRHGRARLLGRAGGRRGPRPSR